MTSPALSLAVPAAASRPDFETQMTQHYQSAYRFLYGLTNNRAEAEDLTQDTFLRAFNAYHTYDPARPFRAWLHRIAYTQFVDNVRKYKNKKALSLDACMENGEGTVLGLELPDSTHDPEWMLEQTEFSEETKSALNSLPEEFRTTILLCDVENLSYEEIAQAMRCSMGTVRSRLHRGRKMLRQALESRRNAAADEALRYA
jgi:RNA polymerase sigma-70 factor, ECF subfamily